MNCHSEVPVKSLLKVSLTLAILCHHPGDARTYEEGTASILSRAVALEQAGKLDKARQTLDEYLELHPGDANVIAERGLCYNGVDFEKCKADITLALAMTKGGQGLRSVVTAYVVRAYANSVLKCKKEAYADIAKAVQLGPQLSEVYHIRGLIKLQYEGNKAALPDFIHGSSLPDANELCIQRTIECAGSLKLKDVQKKWLAVLVAKYPTYENFQKQAEFSFHSQDYPRLLSDADNLIRLAPKRIMGYQFAVDALMNMKNNTSAISYATEALKFAPNEASMRRKRALLRVLDGDQRGAIADFKLLQKLEPKNPEAIEQVAAILNSQGRHEEAADEFERASRLREPPPLAVLTMRADCYRAAEMYEKGAKDYSLIYRLAGSRLAALREGECCIGLRQYHKAIDAFSHALEPKGREKMLSSNEAAIAISQQGLCYLRLNDAVKARDLSTKAIAMKPNMTSAYLVRSQAYIKLGKDDNAIADLTQGIKLDSKLTFLYAERAKLYEKKGEMELAKKDRIKLSRYSQELKSDLMD